MNPQVGAKPTNKYLHMKSTFHKAGNFNLKGKKTKRLSCGCCAAYNYKEREIKREHIKEMKEEKEMA